MADLKPCRVCAKEKPLTSFQLVRNSQLSTATSRRNVCQSCRSARKRTFDPEKSRRFRPDGVYSCTKCRNEFPVSEFQVITRSKSRQPEVHSYCRECARAASRDRTRRRAEREGRRFIPRGVPDPDRRPDATYDFAFACDVLGFSRERAIRWIARGYRGVTEEAVQRWDLPSNKTDWQPDRVSADVNG